MNLRDRYAELPNLGPEIRDFLSALLHEVDRLKSEIERLESKVDYPDGNPMDE
jgi:hypothetical protein